MIKVSDRCVMRVGPSYTVFNTWLLAEGGLSSSWPSTSKNPAEFASVARRRVFRFNECFFNRVTIVHMFSGLADVELRYCVCILLCTSMD